VAVDGSPWFILQEMLEVLQQRGHEVVVVAPEATVNVKASKSLEIKRYSVPFTQEEMDKEFKAFFNGAFEDGTFLERFLRPYEDMKRIAEIMVPSCERLLK
ncbi:UD11 glucuronosyltransferase, partial [Pomatostomus ruficeps]|nr:UD11 glucuronosyltransferase [Pomatostomus ruficeps]